MSVGAVNKSTGERIPTAGMPAIDAALSGSSTNPVQNRVVKAAFDAIKDGQSINSFADVETALGEKADTDIVASDFSAAASYTAGNYCIYEGKFYKFKTSHSGAWSAADVDEIKIAGELSSLMSGLNGLGTFVLLAHEAMPVASVWTPYQDISINVDDYRYFGVKLTKENNTITGTPLCLFSREEFISSNASKPLCALLNTAESSDAYNVFVQYNGESLTPVYYYRGANVSDTLYLTIFGIK